VLLGERGGTRGAGHGCWIGSIAAGGASDLWAIRGGSIVTAMDWRDLWAISPIHLAQEKGEQGVRTVMDGSPARGEESAAWRKAESAACGQDAIWQNRAPSASVDTYIRHLNSSRDLFLTLTPGEVRVQSL
jgi:hypothetical protein